MRVWRLTSKAFADSAFDGEGAARYTGRWNPRGVRMVYAADSLALATLELSVHLGGARITYAAIEVEVPDNAIGDVPRRQLTRGWLNDDSITQRIGARWARSAASVALLVPSSLVDPRSGERNVLINPVHPELRSLAELQRFDVTLDERLQ